MRGFPLGSPPWPPQHPGNHEPLCFTLVAFLRLSVLYADYDEPCHCQFRGSKIVGNKTLHPAQFLRVSLLPASAQGRLGVLVWVTALSPGKAWHTEGPADDGEPGPSEELHSSPPPRPRRGAAGGIGAPPCTPQSRAPPGPGPRRPGGVGLAVIHLPASPLRRARRE